MSTTNKVAWLGAMALALTLGAAAQDGSSGGSRAFLREAIQGDLAEIKLGMLVEQKAQSQKVREFGQTLVRDHQQALNLAKDLAQSFGMSVPETPSDEAQDEYASLEKKSGNAFDKAFLDYAVEEHRKDIDKFQQEASAPNGQQVATLAQNALPTLRKHLDIAQSLMKAS